MHDYCLDLSFRILLQDLCSHEDSISGLSQNSIIQKKNLCKKSISQYWVMVQSWRLRESLGWTMLNVIFWVMYRMQKIHNCQPVLEFIYTILEHTDIKFLCKVELAHSEKQLCIFFFSNAKANGHENRFIAHFYYSKLLAWCWILKLSWWRKKR